MNTYFCIPAAVRPGAAALGSVLAGVAGLVLVATPAFAADTGPTVTGDVCLQQLFGSPVSNSNRVNCTANDISLSQVVEVSPQSCTRGTTFDLTATYQINVTANSRYDAGFIFRIDGGASARGDGTNVDGECSLSGLSVPPEAGSPALNLDGDSCGDLNSGSYNVTFTIPDVECKDSDEDGKLNLPYCTSWHSNQGTACTISNPFSLANAPAFKPDTKSKCVCDDNFEVPVSVEEAMIEVEKSASPETVPEPGGLVTYTVQITNMAAVESVTITSIDDDIYGDLTDAFNPNVSDNDCPGLVGVVLTAQPGESSESCSFKAMVEGGFDPEGIDNVHTNVVEACAQQDGAAEDTCDDDNATVTIEDVFEEPSVDKAAQTIGDCQVEVNYQVVVSNNSDFDTLIVTELMDSQFGDLTQLDADVLATNCVVPTAPIAPLGNSTCQFTGLITGTGSECEDLHHTNYVTADSTDDDGIDFMTDSDSVTVELTVALPQPPVP